MAVLELKHGPPGLGLVFPATPRTALAQAAPTGLRGEVTFS